MAFPGTRQYVTRKRVRARVRTLVGDSDLNRGRRVSFLSTGAGAAGGTTVVSTELTTKYPSDDALNGAYLRCREGINAGEEQLITDYAQTTGTATLSPGFSSTTESAKNYELFERGKFDDLEIEDAIQDSQMKIAKILPDSAKWFLKAVKDDVLALGGSLNIGSDISDLMDLDVLMTTDQSVVLNALDISHIQNIKSSTHPEYATTDRPVFVIRDKNILWIFPSSVSEVDVSYFHLPSQINGLTSASTDSDNLDIIEPWVGDVSLYAAFILTGGEKFLQPLSMPVKQGFGIMQKTAPEPTNQ